MTDTTQKNKFAPLSILFNENGDITTAEQLLNDLMELYEGISETALEDDKLRMRVLVEASEHLYDARKVIGKMVSSITLINRLRGYEKEIDDTLSALSQKATSIANSNKPIETKTELWLHFHDTAVHSTNRKVRATQKLIDGCQERLKELMKGAIEETTRLCREEPEVAEALKNAPQPAIT